MENLNAEKVKEVLKRCASGGRCKGCVRENITTYTIEGCMGMLLGEAIALIESQEQRIGAQDMTISELRQRAEKAEHDADRYAQKIKELTEENERLIEAGFSTAEYAVDKIRGVRIEIVRKMQKRLKECFNNEVERKSIYTESQVLFVIDQIAKEMLESVGFGEVIRKIEKAALERELHTDPMTNF